MTVQELTTVFGNNIKRFRDLYGFTQEQLAEKMDLSVITICAIENGKKFVRADKLVNFATLFKTDVYELLKPENTMPDKASGVLAKYCEDVAKASEKIKRDYLKKMK